ncbi:regulatory protein [Colletotrichum tabaci]|uniref:Regulatory protein n=1 Tax=Colletotrichum tabaci TaxID=1209068 RepID=A0AAV9TSN5_9PEZI
MVTQELVEQPSFGDAPELLDHPGSMEAMLDISDFFNSVGLDFEHGFDFFPPDVLPMGESPAFAPTLGSAPGPCLERPAPESQRPGPSSNVSSSTRICNSIPDTDTGEDDFHELKPLTQPWKVSEAQRSRFSQHLSNYEGVLDGFKLPSRLSISRYIAGFVDGYSNHHPFIHMPTFSAGNYPDSPELVLALLAIGAQFRYETRNANQLYRAGRAIVLHRLKSGEATSPAGNTGVGAEATSTSFRTPTVRMDFLKAILLLATFSAWQEDQVLVRESLEYQGMLAWCIRDGGLVDGPSGDCDDWHVWARDESDRRAKLSAFCFLNLQSLVFGVPPILLANELDLRLPVACDEWLASCPSQWTRARAKGPALARFQKAFVDLVQPSAHSDDDGLVTSPFGNFVLMHALLQRLMMAKQLCLDRHAQRLSPEDGARFELSLHRWREQWRRAPESVLDIKNTKGSLSWTATSLLGLAHVRLYFTCRTQQNACFGSAKSIADDAWDAKPPGRGPQLVYALLHAVHALNIPVQLGIDYLAGCQAFFWSLQHSFCSFEAAIFLSKWLFMLAADHESSGLDANERQIIRWIECIVNEAVASLNEVEGYDFNSQGDTPQSLGILGGMVIRLFAKMFEGCNSAWPIMRKLGNSLHEYSVLLDENGGLASVGRAESNASCSAAT